jgi:hypothetical protein
MERKSVFSVVVFMLLLINNVSLFAGVLVNGSFEADGYIDDITIEEPNGWDVNVPGNFGGWVNNDWVTDGLLNLTVFSDPYTSFDANDIAELSQYVILGDVNQIFFDIRLHTQSGSKIWDPNLRTALVRIGDDVVWESNSVGTDVRDEYFDQVIVVSKRDYQEYKLSLALKCNVDEETTSIKYYADWDNIMFDIYCGGEGFLDSDFSRDCTVNFVDFAMFSNLWRQNVDPNSTYNLSGDGDTETYGIIDFSDIEVFTGDWFTGSCD